MGIVLAHFGPESDMVFEETTGLVNRNGKGDEVNFKGKVKLLFLPRNANFSLLCMVQMQENAFQHQEHKKRSDPDF